MDYQEDELVEVNVVLTYVTHDAIKVEDADGREIWIELHEIKDDGFNIDEHNPGDELTLSLHSSFAHRKGLI